MRVHLLANLHRHDAIEAAQAAGQWLQSEGHIVAADEEAAATLQFEEVPDAAFASCDLVICFGGDGTVIRGAHLCSEPGTPILGVYYGRFGFVTQASGDEVRICVQEFLAGHLALEERMMIQAELRRGQQTVAVVHALNETAVQRAAMMHMLTFDVHVDGRHLTSYPADGVMVCTSTGSTGYNLSAGGPIVDPIVDALILTAISPHTLSARSLVLRPNALIEFRVTTRGEAVLNVDGQSRFHLLSEDHVCVTRSPRVTRLVTVDSQDFLIKLGDRLLWSRSTHEDDEEDLV